MWGFQAPTLKEEGHYRLALTRSSVRPKLVSRVSPKV